MKELTSLLCLLSVVGIVLAADSEAETGEDKKSANSLARGFNDDIDWQTLDDGYATAKAEKKPILLLIHKSWCGACKQLKPKVATSNEMVELSKYFVMVNVEDQEEPEDKKFAPDGGYIPRVIFMTPDGEVIKDLYNKDGNASYKYYYPEATQIISSMKEAIEYVKNDKKGMDEL